jgi:hypothetical protein
VALAVMILSQGYLWEVGVMLMWSTLRSRADLGHVALGTACCLWVRRSCCSGSRTRRMHRHWGVAGLLVRVAFLLLVAGLLGAVALVYCPELPRRLIARLTKHEDSLLTADSDVRD